MLEGINYWDKLADSPSQMEKCFAIFVNVLQLDEHGEPVNEKYAERRVGALGGRGFLAIPSGAPCHGDRPVIE
jgi:hypothetical protein